MKITPALKTWLLDNGHAVPQSTSEFTLAYTTARLMADGVLSAEKYAELAANEAPMQTTTPDPTKVFSGPGTIRVKAEGEKYSETRYATKHVKTGQPVFDVIHGRECQTMSEGSAARAGVLLKHLANRAGLNNPLSEHERGLLNDVSQKVWAGKIGSDWYDHISGATVKALIDDSTSGGIEAVPIEFDSDIVTFPLLSGELYPNVDIKPVPRGRRIEGASIGTPTLSWGGVDASAMPLFDTTSMVQPIDTTIFVINAAVEVGRDFLSDSPANVGATLTSLVGERLAAELDKVIAVGNGSTQPEGIFTASGLATVASTAGGAGPPSMDDYLTLMFSVGKQYRNRGMGPVFLSNDRTYQRRTAIRVDPHSLATTVNQLPVFGPTWNDYQTMQWPHKIQNDLTNRQIAYGALSKYRMYRRLGLEVRWETAGNYLATKNLALLVVRARFGGKVVDANAFAKIVDAQT
jgi:hypothetical protein